MAWTPSFGRGPCVPEDRGHQGREFPGGNVLVIRHPLYLSWFVVVTTESIITVSDGSGVKPTYPN